MTPKTRNAALAKIHLGAKSIGMAEDAYRAMVRTVGRVESGSAKDLDAAGVDRVVAHLARLGATFTRPDKAGRKPTGGADRQAMLAKVDAYLAEAGKPIAYADAMARRMYRTDRVAWLRPDQLRGIIAALEKAAQKAGRPTA